MNCAKCKKSIGNQGEVVTFQRLRPLVETQQMEITQNDHYCPACASSVAPLGYDCKIHMDWRTLTVNAVGFTPIGRFWVDYMTDWSLARGAIESPVDDGK